MRSLSLAACYSYLALFSSRCSAKPTTSPKDLSPESPSSSVLQDVANAVQAYMLVASDASPCSCACNVLKEVFPSEQIFDNNSIDRYMAATTDYWSATNWLSPACIFVPKQAKDVAVGVKVLKDCKAEFAVRGAGHMPNPGFASIGQEGVLISMSELNRISLSSDKSTIDVGGGSRWGEVYAVVEENGLTVVGGRANNVGVAGFLLGGGLSYLDSKFGFGVDNVAAFEVILADSTIVHATSTNSHKDLFWALKGGSSNFGIVTKFTIKTHSIGPVSWQGTIFSSAATNPSSGRREHLESYLDALDKFSETDHVGSALTPVLLHAPMFGGDVVYSNLWSILDVNSEKYQTEQKKRAEKLAKRDDDVPLDINDKDIAPEVFSGFLSVPGKMQEFYNVTFHSALAKTVGDNNPNGARQLLHCIGAKASREALRIISEGFFGNIPKLKEAVPDFVLSGTTLQPISKSMIRYGNSNEGGNAFGLEEEDGPFYWASNFIAWTSPSSDEAVANWAKTTFDTVVSELKEKGLSHKFIYMNDASFMQDVFGGYGEKALKKLMDIREVYDPERLWKKGLKGGFKIPESDGKKNKGQKEEVEEERGEL